MLLAILAKRLPKLALVYLDCPGFYLFMLRFDKLLSNCLLFDLLLNLISLLLQLCCIIHFILFLQSLGDVVPS